MTTTARNATAARAAVRAIAPAVALAVALITSAAGARAAAAAAAEITARVSQQQIAEGESFDLLLSASGDVENATPDLSVLDKDFEILARRQGQRISIVNGHTEASLDWIVTLTPRHVGTLTIPAIHVGSASTAPIAIEATTAAAGHSAAARGAASGAGATGTAGAAAGQAAAAGGGSPDLFVEASVDQDAPIVQGEVRYVVRVFDGVGIRDGALTEPMGDQLRFTPVGEPRTREETRGGRRYRVHEREFTVTPEKSGDLVIPPVTLQARVPAPRAQAGARSRFGAFGADDPDFDDPFDDAFAQFAGRFGFGADLLERMAGGRAVRVRSNAVALHVKARPNEAAGEWFLPARSVELRESWSPAQPTFRVGEAVTRTIALRALGSSAEQLPRFEIPTADGIRQYPEGSRDGSQPTDDGTISVLEQTVSLVPTRAGHWTLPAVEVRWWDVEDEQMHTARLPEKTIEVLPPASAASTTSEHVATTDSTNDAGEHRTTGATAATAATGDARHLSVPPTTKNDPATAGSPTSAMDAAPPPAAARPHSGAIALGAAVLALLLLAGASLLLRRRARAAAPPTPGTHPDESPSRALAAVRSACKANDAAAAGAALLGWGRAHWTASPPRNTPEIAARLGGPADLARALAALDAQLYGRSASAWDGSALWKAFDAARSSAGATRTGATSELPPLYPDGRRRAA